MKKSFEEIVLFARTGLNPRTNFKLGQGKNKYITIKNIHNNRIIIDDNTDIIDDEAIRMIHRRSQIKKGDILFASIGRMGDMYIIDEEPEGWDINESVFAFTVDTNIIRQKYFYYIFRNHSTLDYLASNSSGSTFKSIKMNQLKKMVFDIPTLQEQDMIIGILDKVCEAIELYQFQINRFDDLIKSRFVEMFGDPMINPFDFPIKTIREVAYLNKGITYSPEDVAEEGMIVLRSSNIKGNVFDLTDLVKITKIISPEKYVQENDILMCNRNGSARLVGKVAKIPKLEENMTFGTFMTIVRSDMQEYLFTFFQQDAFREQIKFQTAVAINQISLPLLASVKVPVPPHFLIDEFTTFVHQIDKLKLEEILKVGVDIVRGLMEDFDLIEISKVVELYVA